MGWCGLSRKPRGSLETEQVGVEGAPGGAEAAGIGAERKVALANAFKTDVNSLPLSLILSWYEQKAACILLTLLSLGIKNMRLGPSLPACVTPPVLQVLVDKFNIIPITTPEADLKAILG